LGKLNYERTIAEYLNASVETGDPDVMLSALSAVARARGMADLAEKAGVNRESLYKALAPGAKPRYDTIFRVARALGVEMVFRCHRRQPRPRGRRPPPALQRAAARLRARRSRIVRHARRPEPESAGQSSPEFTKTWIADPRIRSGASSIRNDVG
jgi:probable addiction module antidote protein